MDQVRPQPIPWPKPRERRLVGLSSSDTIRWRPCADPVQKRDPGDRMTQKGLTNRGPLQKDGLSSCDTHQLPPMGFARAQPILQSKKIRNAPMTKLSRLAALTAAGCLTAMVAT